MNERDKFWRKAIPAISKKIRILSDKALNSNLDAFCGDFAEAYRCGVEEAQGEMIDRLQNLQEHLRPVPLRDVR